MAQDPPINQSQDEEQQQRQQQTEKQPSTTILDDLDEVDLTPFATPLSSNLDISSNEAQPITMIPLDLQNPSGLVKTNEPGKDVDVAVENDEDDNDDDSEQEAFSDSDSDSDAEPAGNYVEALSVLETGSAFAQIQVTGESFEDEIMAELQNLSQSGSSDLDSVNGNTVKVMSFENTDMLVLPSIPASSSAIMEESSLTATIDAAINRLSSTLTSMDTPSSPPSITKTNATPPSSTPATTTSSNIATSPPSSPFNTWSNDFIPADVQLPANKGGTIRRKKKNQEEEVSITAEEIFGAPTWQQRKKQSGFGVGFSEDRNKRFRRTMEDAHSLVYDYGGVRGQGWFAVFDGHAGKQAADYCGQYLHHNLLAMLEQRQDYPIPAVLNETFISTDTQLLEKCGMMAGCTAATVFLRVEERPSSEDAAKGIDNDVGKQRVRVLYGANCGDARTVLCRGGRAIRLSYDHKGTDHQEIARIQESGGFIVNGRVNGILAVTRSFGDHAMKEYVLGSPYTTETVLTSKDEFIIIACDGLWDVCQDDEAVELVRGIEDPQEASQILLQYALENGSMDNLSIMVIRLDTGFNS